MENKYRFAKELVYEAGRLISSTMKSELVIETKTSPTDLVTNLDQQIQARMMEKILQHYPKDHILAEENNVRHDIEDGSVWVIDPIDGTINFIAQGFDFVIMLSYFENGVGQFAFIYDVTRDELYHGGGSFTVYKNDEALPYYESRPFQTYLCATNSGMFEQNQWGLADLAGKTLGIRIYGSAGISFCRVLAGQLLFYVSYIYPWDYAAASILGEKLGYLTLTMDGQRPDFKTRQAVIMFPEEKFDEMASYLPSLREGLK